MSLSNLPRLPRVSPPLAPRLSLGEPGMRMGRWRLRTLIGTGAEGETWRAVREDGLTAALKLLPGPPAEELRVLSRLAHPAIPTLLDSGGWKPGYFVMDRIDGRPLSAIAEDGAILESWVSRWAITLFDALAAVHLLGHVHGDLKPDHILVDGKNDVHLIDFGLSGGKGGSPPWIAPERSEGIGATPEGDVYVAGLLIYWMLHGHLPYPRLSPGEAMARAGREVPPIERGNPAMRALLARALHPDPKARLRASMAVDLLMDQGLELPRIDAELVRRRARVVRIPRGGVDGALHQWIERGASLLLVGPRGSGRTTALQGLLLELRAQGRAVLHLTPADGPWGAILPGLGELGWRVPEGPDSWTRARLLARRIVSEGVLVVVDDLDRIEHESARVIDQLLAARGPVVASSPHGWPSFRQEVRLDPLDGDGLGQLAQGLLGEGADQANVRRAMWEASRGHVGEAVAFVVAAVESGALRTVRRNLVFDPTRLPPPASLAPGVNLPPAESSAGRVGAMLALTSRPLPVARLSALTDLPDEEVDRALDQLVAGGWVVIGDGRVRMEQRGRTAFLQERTNLSWHRHRLLREALEAAHPEADLITELAAAVGDVEVLRTFAARGVSSRAAVDPIGANRLAEAAWAHVDTPALAAARLRALAAAGQTTAALAFGETRFVKTYAPKGGPEEVLSLVELASICLSQLGQPGLAIDWVERARAAVGSGSSLPELDLVDAGVRLRLGDAGRAVQLAEGIAGGPPPSRVGMEGAEALDLWLRGRVVLAQATQANGDIQRAIDLLTGIPEDIGKGRGTRAMLDASRGRLLWMAGRFSEADGAMRAASENDSGLSMLDRARLLNNLGALRYGAGDRAGAVRAWEQALHLFQQLMALLESVRVLGNLCVGYRDLGRWDRAREAGEKALAGARELAAEDLECNTLLNLGALEMSRGRLIEAEAFFGQAEELAHALRAQRELVEAWLRKAEVMALREQPGVVELAMRAAEEADRQSMVSEGALALSVAALGLARRGESWKAIAPLAERALNALSGVGAKADLASARLWLAEALLLVGEGKEARVMLDKAKVFAHERGDAQMIARCEALDARIDTLWQDPERDSRLEKLIAMAVCINEATELDDVLDQIARAGLELVGGERAFVLLGDPPELMASALLQGVSGAPARSVVARAIQDRREVIAADVDEHADLRTCRSVVSLELRSVLCVPLLHREEVLGALYVDSRSITQKHLWSCVLVMRGLAALAAVAVVRARLHAEGIRQARESAQLAERARAARELAAKNEALEQLNTQLRHAAVTDALTGLFNRRHLLEVLANLHWELSRGGRPYGVLIIDVDHFKKVNDTWGHGAGDRVLVDIARQVRAVLRSEDRACRYGGEELVVILTAPQAGDLQRLGERIRAVVAATPFEMTGGTQHPVTVSVGGTLAAVEKDLNWDAVLHRADTCLYQAKSEGRNRVVVSLPEEGWAHRNPRIQVA